MDPQLSGFALGLLFAAAKVGAIGTIARGHGRRKSWGGECLSA